MLTLLLFVSLQARGDGQAVLRVRYGVGAAGGGGPFGAGDAIIAFALPK